MPIFILLILASILSACAAPVVLFGGAAGAGVTLSKQKTVGSSIDDTSIWTKIKAAFLKHNKEIDGIMTNVSVEVSEGRVLLTGKVNSVDDRLRILQLVWEQTGVREVINELKLNENGTSFKGYSKDVWITTQVKSKLLANKEIHSLNYNVETLDATVYIIGIAGSEAELAQVVSEAESVKNVEKVVNFIRVKGEKTEIKSSDERTIPEAEEIRRPKIEPKIKTNKSNFIEDSSEDSDHVIEIGQDNE